MTANPLDQIRARAREFEAARQWGEAARLYEAELEACHGDGCYWLLTSLAEMSLHQRDYRASRRWLHEAGEWIARNPGDRGRRVELRNARAALFLVEGKVTAAARELAGAADEAAGTPALPGILHNLANAEMQMGRYGQAERRQREALRLWRAGLGERHESVMRAWINLSSIQALRGNWRAAEESILRALAIAESPEARANYAVVLDRLGRGKEAREMRKRITVEAPAGALIDINATQSGLRAVAR